MDQGREWRELVEAEGDWKPFQSLGALGRRDDRLQPYLVARAAAGVVERPPLAVAQP
ncbi:hypothetical protein [Mumia zhuanghuii]|uniref:hypothetical protein n=1 Tax=Mumia zhuanghuii TaxID=2585211 RepID=UPI00129CEF83|nr:hypothetical protein [Mumia zhuanghuii]